MFKLKWKKLGISLLCFQMVVVLVLSIASAEEKKIAKVDLTPSAKSAVLLDVDTGTVIQEKNGNEKLPPASITKIMTMLLIMEAIDQGKIKMEDKVRTSEFAASMGGSQI